MPEDPDYFAVLFAVLSMQVLQKYPLRQGVILIAAFIPLTAIPLVKAYNVPEAIVFALTYTAANAIWGSYSLATRRAQAARIRNENLSTELQEANQQLRNYSKQLEQLAVARERNRVARDLHDSVTQTIFSMNLTTDAILMMLESEPDRVKGQLDQLQKLTMSAQAEMQLLISELEPISFHEGGLAGGLRQHLAERRLPQGLSITLEVNGSQPLKQTEEQALFRIAQEAINNIVKHSQASQASIRLQLVEPCWMEITDQGRGFDLNNRAPNSTGFGLLSMRGRAEEIGWSWRLISTPGAGTCIRVEKIPHKA
jgi:signal transduction histidine kinase